MPPKSVISFCPYLALHSLTFLITQTSAFDSVGVCNFACFVPGRLDIVTLWLPHLQQQHNNAWKLCPLSKIPDNCISKRVHRSLIRRNILALLRLTLEATVEGSSYLALNASVELALLKPCSYLEFLSCLATFCHRVRARITLMVGMRNSLLVLESSNNSWKSKECLKGNHPQSISFDLQNPDSILWYILRRSTEHHCWRSDME